MNDTKDLNNTLKSINGRGYKAYNDIRGSYKGQNYVLFVEHVQRDPFASPSIIRLEIDEHGFPEELFSNITRKVALEDYISRQFSHNIHKYHTSRSGSGKSGLIQIDAGGQEILERSCVNVNNKFLEIRFTVGLPAQGRRILSNEAIKIFCQIIPKLVNSVFYETMDSELVYRHVETCEDATYIRDHLKELGLVAFIRDGSILPRKSGISPLPLDGAVIFESPTSLKCTIDTPNKGQIKGMGIPFGVTLIVGGGYHGKSTLLNSLELGIYNHIGGDGREMVITDESAVKIRAEDGRSIKKTDISAFIHEPPLEKSTQMFSTENASGSTSQAANIVEALEAGSDLLLFDEDTSASNFMIRDERMQKLVKKEKEPITPFIDRVQELYQEHGVSTILVMGGSGDYFDVADTVIMMDHYRPLDVTLQAYEVARELPSGRQTEAEKKFKFKERIPLSKSIKPYKGRRIKLDARGRDNLVIGKFNIDLSLVEQIVSSSQTRALSYGLYHASNSIMDGEKTIREVLAMIEFEISRGGLDTLSPPGRFKPHNIAGFRRFEFAAALNRIRSLNIL